MAAAKAQDRPLMSSPGRLAISAAMRVVGGRLPRGLRRSFTLTDSSALAAPGEHLVTGPT